MCKHCYEEWNHAEEDCPLPDYIDRTYDDLRDRGYVPTPLPPDQDSGTEYRDDSDT